MESGEKPKRRLFRLLRRGARASGVDAGRTAVEETALWASHEHATTAVRDAGEAAQRIASHVAKQRGVVDALADRTRGLASRASDLAVSFERLKDAFSRLELVALNAGLEGARLAEGPGHALGLVADEVRSHSARGSEACRELGVTLGEVGGELLQVNANLDHAREAAAEVAGEVARASGASAAAERALAEMSERLKKTTGSDPEIARALVEATEHARALVTSLGALSGKAPPAFVVAALRPVLEPLIRLIEGTEEAEE